MAGTGTGAGAGADRGARDGGSASADGRPHRDETAEARDSGADRDATLVALLTQRRAEVQARLARLDVDERSVLTDRADATADDEHDPEGSTLSGEWSRLDAFRRGAEDELIEIDEAIDGVSAGTYGVCVQCGRVIPLARLEARPMATRCVVCAA